MPKNSLHDSPNNSNSANVILTTVSTTELAQQGLPRQTRPPAALKLVRAPWKSRKCYDNPHIKVAGGSTPSQHLPAQLPVPKIDRHQGTRQTSRQTCKTEYRERSKHS